MLHEYSVDEVETRRTARTLSKHELPLDASPREIEAFLTSRTDGSPLTTEQLARVLGVGTPKIRADIEAGELRAFQLASRSRRMWRIKFDDARAYLARMGVITVSVRTVPTSPSTSSKSSASS